MEQTDEQLVFSYLSGNEDALEQIFERYIKSIYRFVFSFVQDSTISNDLTQDVFVKTWKNLKKFDRNKSFKTWLYTIAKNTVFDYLKKKNTVNFSEIDNNGDFENTLSGNLGNAEQIFENAENSKILSEAILGLPVKQQVIITLHYFNELSLVEISNVIEESVNTVKSRHFRAIKSLQEKLNNKTNN